MYNDDIEGMDDGSSDEMERTYNSDNNDRLLAQGIRAPAVGDRAEWKQAQPAPDDSTQFAQTLSDRYGNPFEKMIDTNPNEGYVVKPVGQTMSDNVRNKGAYADLPTYMADVRKHTYELAKNSGIDLSSPEGQQWINATITQAKASAPEYIAPTIDPKSVKELSDGTVINLITGKIIHRPFSADVADASTAHTATVDALQASADASKEGVNPPTIPTIMQRSIEEAHKNPAFAASKQGKAALAEEKNIESSKGLQGLDKQSISDLAKSYIITGKLPSIGIGKEAATAKMAILKEYGRIMKDEALTPEDVALKQATYSANSKELVRLQTLRGPAEVAANKADKAIAYAGELSKKVHRTGVPVLNKYILAGRKAVAGDPDITALDGAVTTSVNEYVKATSGNGTTSDAAREHAYDLLNKAQTQDQFDAAVKTLHREIGIARGSWGEQIEELKGNMKEGDKSTSQEPDTKTSPTSRFIKGKKYADKNGVAHTWDGTKMVK